MLLKMFTIKKFVSAEMYVAQFLFGFSSICIDINYQNCYWDISNVQKKFRLSAIVNAESMLHIT